MSLTLIFQENFKFDLTHLNQSHALFFFFFLLNALLLFPFFNKKNLRSHLAS